MAIGPQLEILTQDPSTSGTQIVEPRVTPVYVTLFDRASTLMSTHYHGLMTYTR